MKTKPALDQLPLFDLKQRGGYRGGHRQKGAGSTVMRIPNELLGEVTKLIESHKRGGLSHVTELKTEHPQRFYDAYIKAGYTTQIWSGCGRKPLWLQNLAPGETIEKYRNPNPSQPMDRAGSTSKPQHQSPETRSNTK